ncbi:MAG: hypothetical protein ACFCVK_26300 [Acidimicrobiales bacterium]
MPRRFGRGAARAVAVASAVAVTGVGLGGCGSTPPADGYTAEHRDAFLAACTEAGSDPRVVRDVCECTYERIESTMPFDDFVVLEASLRLDTLEPLPEPIAELMADCFVDEVDL